MWSGPSRLQMAWILAGSSTVAKPLSSTVNPMPFFAAWRLALRVRKPHPDSSGGMLVLVKEPTQPIVSADDRLLERSWIGDRIREQA
jgi:hypothetical protein